MTHDPAAILRERLVSAIRSALADLGIDAPETIDPILTPSRQPKLGDFQSNAAMPLAKAAGKNPRDLAAAIAKHLDVSGVAEPLNEQSIAGPGFLNLFLSRDALASALDAMDSSPPARGRGRGEGPGDHAETSSPHPSAAQTPSPQRGEGAYLGIAPAADPKTIVVDLCGVNLAKQMHVGHLRSTIIGDAISRLFARLGHTVIRQNHLGDWGLPIAMVTELVMRETAAGRMDPNTLTLDDLDSAYRAAQRECKADARGLAAVKKYGLGPKALAELEEQVASAEDALARAKQTLIKLQSGDGATVAAWERIAQITIDECVRICARMGAIVLPEHTAGESSYREELAGVVRDLESRKVATESQGALVVDVSDAGISEPLLIRKSDGGFLYATTDLAAIRRRVQEFGADEVVYCVDARQSLHFKQVFAGAHKAGYTKRPDGSAARLEHAAFGTILGEDGRPFKTRSGENVKLAALLDEAVERAGRAVAERNPDLSSEERETIAHAVGIGAIKYADLSGDRVKDYVFSFDRMLAFEGDTGPYLLYALVRVKSILRKAREQGVATGGNSAFRVDTPEEKRLALAILRYPSVVESAADALEPHRLCGYLSELAGAFSTFFTACPVLQAPDDATRDSRLRLCALTGKILEDGLSLLGITALERM
ncbi:MAG: arginine--tRNA ligase [Phycisphaeraceae bacterium]|nr:arginine--tRNA ligase [Phycisphaeraceae bacterium]